MTLPLVVHVTHEAGLKIGGIGAVLEGLLASDAYTDQVQRTILAGPFPAWDTAQMDRIVSQRSRLQVRYASRYGIYGLVPPDLGRRFHGLERALNINIFYGLAPYGAHCHEVLLVDPTNLLPDVANLFAYDLYANYHLQPDRYAYDAEWTGFVQLATALAQAIEALAADAMPGRGNRFAIAHDWMGLPPVLALQLQGADRWSTVYYAHEVAPVRRLVEEHEGHDTRYYNVMRKAEGSGVFLDSVFGSQDDWFKVPLLHQAIRCDAVLAVSDLVRDELRFLGTGFADAPIDLVYNGIPSQATTLDEKNTSRDRLRSYCRALHGFLPDFVFTHVTRMVPSKGMWRDAKVLSHLARCLAGGSGQTAVLFVLSTGTGTGRPPDQVHAWEETYGWPVGHRADNGDLVGMEAAYFFDVVEPFNRDHANAKIVFVNQFGWDRMHCGRRMPDDMSFVDIRRGSDLEFGLSIYEPFGIAQLEALTHGAVCCISSACGCRGFVARVATSNTPTALVVEADYVSLPDDSWVHSPWDALHISREQRDRLEEYQSEQTAREILKVLARNDDERSRNLEWGQAASATMGWDTVARDLLLPALHRLQTQT